MMPATLTLTADVRSGGLASLDLTCYDDDTRLDGASLDDLSDSSDVTVRFTTEEIADECRGTDIDALLDAVMTRAEDQGRDLTAALAEWGFVPAS